METVEILKAALESANLVLIIGLAMQVVSIKTDVAWIKTYFMEGKRYDDQETNQDIRKIG